VGALRALLGVQPRVDAPDPVELISDAGLRAALLELAPLDREAVVLTVWFDLASADAARALGITPAAYRMRMTRARRRLRAALSTASTVEDPQWT
jgi:RNA polymerase sigma-70 factor (ECF subfamily)